MCTGLEPLLMAAAGGAAASAVVGSVLQKKPPAAPDPAKERAKAEAEAAQKANASISMQRRAMRNNSLLTGAGDGTLGGPAATPAGGRSTLGV